MLQNFKFQTLDLNDCYVIVRIVQLNQLWVADSVVAEAGSGAARQHKERHLQQAGRYPAKQLQVVPYDIATVGGETG